MPTKELPLRWTDDKEHLRKISMVSGGLLHGAHNEVYTLEVLTGSDYTRFPNGGSLLGGGITAFATVSGTTVRATTSSAHGLAVGEIACIASPATYSAYQGSWTITAVDTVANDFDFDLGVAFPGTDTALLYQGLTNLRITPSTVGVTAAQNANAAALESYSTAAPGGTGMYQVANVGYIEFFHTGGAGALWGLVLFGD